MQLVVLEKGYNNNNKKKRKEIYDWPSIFWLGRTITWTTRCKNLHRFTVKGHNIRSKPVSTANHKLLWVPSEWCPPAQLIEQNGMITQGLPLVDGKECHFAQRAKTTFDRHLIETAEQTQSHRSARLCQTVTTREGSTSPKQALARQERTQINMQARSRQFYSLLYRQ